MKRKAFKGRLNNKINTKQTLWKGYYGAVAFESARISEAQIKAVELAIKRVLKRNGNIWLRINTQIPVTKKPTEVRMGKGKGNISYYMARVYPGQIIFELNAPNEILARKAYKIAISKLPIKTKFIQSN